MAKVAVVKCRHGEHPDKIQSDGHTHGNPTPSSPNHTKASYVQKYKWDGAAEFKTLGERTHVFRPAWEVVGVDRVYNSVKEFFHV